MEMEKEMEMEMEKEKKEKDRQELALPWTLRMSARSVCSWRPAWSAIFFLSRWISQCRSEMMLVYWAMW